MTELVATVITSYSIHYTKLYDGGTGGVLDVRRQRDMHLRRALPHLACRDEVGPDQVRRKFRDLLADHHQRGLFRAGDGFRLGGQGHRSFVIPAQVVQRVFPDIPLVRNESLENGECNRLLV